MSTSLFGQLASSLRQKARPNKSTIQASKRSEILNHDISQDTLLIDVDLRYYRILMIKTLLLLFVFIVSLDAQARIFVDVFITHHKGIDQGLTLMSELQSFEKMIGRERKILEMKNGIRLEFNVEFVDQKGEAIGPIGRVRFFGRLLNSRRELLQDFSAEDSEVELGEEWLYSYDDKSGQLIEIRLVPYL
jgi:hypothetical protein